MSEPIVVTEEMRQAVYRDECVRSGHQFDANSLIYRTQSGGQDIPIELPNGKLPHVRCARCDKTWVLISDPGDGYDDAETKIRKRLYAADPVNKRPERPGKKAKA